MTAAGRRSSAARALSGPDLGDERGPRLRLVLPSAAERPDHERRARAVRLALNVAIVASGWLALACQWVAHLGPVRPLVVFGFVLVAPGAAVVARLPLVDRAERAALAVAISIAVAMPVSEAFAFAHSWSASKVLATLAVLTTLAVVVRRPRAKPVAKPEWRPLYGPYPIKVNSGRIS